MTGDLFPKEEVSFIFVFTIVVYKCVGQGLLNTVFHFTFKWYFTYISLRPSVTSQVKNYLKVGVARCCTFSFHIKFPENRTWSLGSANTETCPKSQQKCKIGAFFAGRALLQMDVTIRYSLKPSVICGDSLKLAAIYPPQGRF